MNFDLLQDPDYRAENKQRINLSTRAYQILANDAVVFTPREEDGASAANVSSHLINRIFESYREYAEASPVQALERRRIELEEELSSLDAVRRDAVIPVLLSSYQSALDDKICRLCSEKGVSLSIRVSTGILAFLSSPDGQAEGVCYRRIFGSSGIGRYLKAVIEEYAALPFPKREEICCRALFSDIRQAIAGKTVIHITCTRNRDSFFFAPIEIRQDNAGLYNYFVGVARRDPKECWKPICFRAASILQYRTTAAVHTVSASERKQIAERIRRYGVQFLSASGVHPPITVRLTPEGERMYRTMLHQRPLYISRSGDLYHFDCTEFQAKVYFFRFGKEAAIVSPPTLAEEFRKGYEAALENYRIDR